MVGVWEDGMCLENTILPQGRVFDSMMMDPVQFDSVAAARMECARKCDERVDCFYAQFRTWTVMPNPQGTPYFACGLVGKDDCTEWPDMALPQDKRSVYHKGIAANVKHF